MAGLVSIAVDKKGKRAVLIEVQDEKAAGPANLGPKLSAGGKTIKEAGKSLEEALDDIAPAIEALRKMATAVSSPKEVTLEVGLKLTAAAGVVLASAGAEGTIKVTMKWA
jgi:translation elongation factor EF-Ts